MRAQARRRKATYSDLLKVPDHLVAQIIDGELIVSPRPAYLHGGATGDLYSELSGPFQRGRGGPGGWWLCFEPELHLADDILVPDIAGWRRERMPQWPDAPFVELAPDWICEVLSPWTGRLDRAGKLPIYGREKVRHAWLVDPVQKTLEVLRLEPAGWLLVATFAGDAAVRAEPFDAIELDLAGLWLK